MLRYWLLFSMLTCAFLGEAQFATTPLFREHKGLIEAWQLSQDDSRHHAIRQLMPIDMLDSVRAGNTETWTRKERKSWVMRKLRNEHLITVRKPDFYLNGDVVFDLTYGRYSGTESRNVYHNTRGIRLEGAIGKRVFFTTSLYENQSVFPEYMEEVVTGRQSVPGMGRYKIYENFAGDTAYDYSFATGVFGVAINEHSFVQAGYGRDHIGHGFRSLFISDASFPYPFLGIHLGFFENKLRYSHTWASTQGLNRVQLGTERNKEFPFSRKRLKYSYLSAHPWKFLEIGLFHAFLQPQWNDSTQQDVLWHYYLPVWGASTAFSSTGTNNSFGLNLSVAPLRFLRLYGQVATQRIGSSGGLQLGIHIVDPFKWNHLSFRIEYNESDLNNWEDDTNLVGIASTKQLPEGLRFTHNGQALGYPLDPYSQEFLVQGSLRIRDWVLSGKCMIYSHSVILSNQFPDRDIYLNAEAAYIINPMSNGQLTAGITARSTGYLTGGRIFYFGFRTGLLNRYSEF